jgi:hypothetical protein
MDVGLKTAVSGMERAVNRQMLRARHKGGTNAKH